MRKGPHPLSVHMGMIASNSALSISEFDAVQMMRGIKIYQQHPYIQPELPCDIVWSDGATKIKKPVSSSNKNGHPLLLVPSLINKANILDISKEKSMLRWFNDNGIEAYLLDWGGVI